MTALRGRATAQAAAIIGALAISASAPGRSWAQQTDPDYAVPEYKDPSDRAREYNIRARKAYDLGKFQKAVDLYTRAYEELPDGAFLFNIAQSYRQLENCKQALFFYKRFLAVKKDIPAGTKKEVDGHIVILEECVKKQDELRRRPTDDIRTPEIGNGGPAGPPDNPTGGTTTKTSTTGTGTAGAGTVGAGTGTVGTGATGTGTGATGTGTTGTATTGTGTTATGATATGAGTTGIGDDGGERPGGDRVADTRLGPADPEDEGRDVVAPVEPSGQPRLVIARVGVGAAVPGFGDLEVEAPAQLSFAIGAGYPISLGSKLMIDVGPTVSMTRFPWAGMGNVKGSSNLIGILGNVGLSVAATPKIGVRVDVGGGVLMFSGLSEGNPFTMGDEAPGSITVPHVRAGLTGEYLVSSKLAVQLVPIAFGFSPRQDALDESVNALTQIQFMAGVAFRQ